MPVGKSNVKKDLWRAALTCQEKNPQDCLLLSQIPPPLEYPEFGHSYRELASLSDFSTRWAGAVLEYVLSAPDKYKHL